jgi:hypothetical protein
MRQLNGLSDHVAFPVVMALPELVAQHRDRLRIGTFRSIGWARRYTCCLARGAAAVDWLRERVDSALEAMIMTGKFVAYYRLSTAKQGNSG